MMVNVLKRTNNRRICRGIFLSGALMVCTLAQAATVTLTFDEAGISLGSNLSDQYASDGVTFGGSVATVKDGTATYFSNTFTTDGNIVHFDSKPVSAVMTLSSLADSLSFDYRRPGSSGDIGVRLLNGTTEVFSNTAITWNGPDWETFTYDGSNGLFDSVEFLSSNKYVIDNVTFNTSPVPLPLPLWLAASGLVPILVARRRT